MNKIFLVSVLVMSALHAMENPKEKLLKFALLEFVKTSNLAAVKHFLNNGQWHLIDKEIKDIAKSKYEILKKEDPNNFFDAPETQIFYAIQTTSFTNRGPKEISEYSLRTSIIH